MPSKPAKSNKKEQTARTDSPELASNNLSMAGIAGLLEDHRRALSADFKSAISTLEAKLDRIQATVSEHGQTIASLESNANLQDERMLGLEATCATLTDSNVKLLAKVADLESRSRRNNIRIVGLPESIEGPHPTTFFPKLLMEVFGEAVLDSPPECDRAHRSLTDKPKPGQRPRPVIIRVHRYQQKEKIIPGQERQATVPRYAHRHLRGLHTRSDGTAPQIPRGDGGALQPRAQASPAVPCEAFHRIEGGRPPSLDSPYD
ncbi:hypothetical protein JOQ06_001120 [Pogonophryne albipinna]|uniref:Transposase n=1 Tax=Pogonophryne albipinna TaxID=1090488 RepID=A0AAD6B5F7_9TELE|nr:hypothetical protein JOQ06_001120 [Pogonophryne albipinna]